MSYSSPLIKNQYEQWVHNYLNLLSKPMWKLQQGYCEMAFYEAWRWGLYELPRTKNRSLTQDGWSNFVKGIQSMYQIYDFRAGCTKAKQIIASRHERKEIMDLWTALPRTARENPAAAKIASLQSSLKAAEESSRSCESEVLRLNSAWLDADKALGQATEAVVLAFKERAAAEEAKLLGKTALVNARKAECDLLCALKEAKAEAEKPQVAEPVDDSFYVGSCYLPMTTDTFKKLKPCQATLPPGTYYVGDPCYPLGDSWIYKKAWDSAGYTAPAYFRSDRGVIVVANTAWGDGGYHETHYKGEKGMKEYLVDSGTISIISVALIVDEVKRLAEEGKPRTTFESLVNGGHIHSFKNGVDVDFRDGKFSFYGDGGFTINTDGCKGCCDEENEENDE